MSRMSPRDAVQARCRNLIGKLSMRSRCGAVLVGAATATALAATPVQAAARHGSDGRDESNASTTVGFTVTSPSPSHASATDGSADRKTDLPSAEMIMTGQGARCGTPCGPGLARMLRQPDQ